MLREHLPGSIRLKQGWWNTLFGHVLKLVFFSKVPIL